MIESPPWNENYIKLIYTWIGYIYISYTINNRASAGMNSQFSFSKEQMKMLSPCSLHKFIHVGMFIHSLIQLFIYSFHKHF